MKIEDYELPGQFYLGKSYDLQTRKAGPPPVLYDSKDLTTHAVCVGMTGSGKTGLCLALLEEAAIDGIPIIAIDPKGDIGNLLLTFPELRAEDFAPWVDPDEAGRQNISPAEYAAKTARTWREGLESWGQPQERIKRFRDAVDMSIYTPGSSAGLPLTVLRSFSAPPPALLSQAEAYRERVASSVSGLLALLGIDADPITSHEHILLSNVLDHAWRGGRDLDMAGFIHGVQSPPFDKVGVIDLETFYPAKQRFALAMRLNNLLASPGFAAWMEGESLDVANLLFTREGKPRLSILSIAHLSDAERMFFVTILLNELLAWIRTQPGTSSLRAILYMDEIFGYFPPSASPPSKRPMLTLLKQARAFGLGIVLATQNPVDLDYKGLSNAGTWFLGRLQTKRDKDRVLEGLEGASISAGQEFDRATMDKKLSALGNRVFLMSNVHDEVPTVFQTRWVMSYLRGPLTREQIQTLMAGRKQAGTTGAAKAVDRSSPEAPSTGAAATSSSEPVSTARSRASQSSGDRPVVPPDVPEFYIPRRERSEAGATLVYRPSLLGVARLHYADKKLGVDHWTTLALQRPMDGEFPADVWDGARVLTDHVPELDKAPEPGARFSPLPGELARGRAYAEYTKSLKNHLYRDAKLTIWSCPELKAYSRPGETQRDFRLRLALDSREQRDRAVEALRARYAEKREKAQDLVRKARERLDREQAQASSLNWDAAISLGNSVLGAFLGRKTVSKANVGRAATAAKAATRAMKEQGDISSARAGYDAALEKFTELELKIRDEIEAIEATGSPERLKIDKVELTPRKADITIEHVVLAWSPQTSGAGETAAPS